MMRTIYLLLLSTYLLTACADEGDQLPMTTDEDEKQPTDTTITETPLVFQYLALGDSYSIGQDVYSSQTWPSQLRTRLVQNGFSINWPRVIAKTGWTTGSLLGSMKSESNLLDEYHLISLLIGVNNQFQGRSIEEFELEFKELLDRSIELAAQDTNRIIVLSIPDYGVTPFGQSMDPDKIKEELDEFNALKKRITEEYGIHYFDITEISRQALTDQSLIASDQLHPSGEMYALWVDLILPQVEEILKSQE